MTEVRITVPGVPPSVNHYKMRTRKGVTFVSKEAKAFKAALYVIARGQRFHGYEGQPYFIPERPEFYEVEVTVFQGKGDKGDVDNYAKLVLDGLAEAEIVHSDAAITDLILHKRRDRENPRTEIIVREAV